MRKSNKNLTWRKKIAYRLTNSNHAILHIYYMFGVGSLIKEAEGIKAEEMIEIIVNRSILETVYPSQA